MKNYRVKCFVWDMLSVLSAFAGVLGTLAAWESGAISFFHMVAQAAFFAAFSYAAFNTSTQLRRSARAARRRAVRRASPAPAVVLRAA